ncbi:TPA: hypothetical protein SAZ37_003737 [Yersinia enterocolitica]|nr:hypothetical protein [Yersinia enterocolitica]HEF7271356.1 hypothetical protein [Yersinia enterocolitica]HEI6726014.1 hypothetical protein [Yersinia enterocolitica]HEI6762040.1 hypothetical protein [Yersinia enterocolitica]HEI6827077.1 hypothetical protein [Yersinia enterocolitica]
MNMNYKKLIMGLLLLVQFPAAIANSGSTIDYTAPTHSHQCSVNLLDDNSVEVSFVVRQPTLTFAPIFQRDMAKLLKIPQHDAQHIIFNPNSARLSLYFYHADGMRDSFIPLSNIRNLLFNGIAPDLLNSKENTQEIQFNSQSLIYSDLGSTAKVTFDVPAHTLTNISIAATVGGELKYKDQSYSFLSSDGVSFSSDGKSCRSFNPQAAIAPEALKIDPEFRIDSAVWELAPLDLDELLDKTANNHGLPALFNHPNTNRFCLHYRSIATRSTQYMISANNDNKLAPNNQHFQLKEAEGNSFINYKVGLRSNENAGADFELPKDKKYIQLKSDDNQVMSNMCWEPNITLFRTDTTDKGSYSDTLNFTITPMA